jgi:hypothetical protein
VQSTLWPTARFFVFPAAAELDDFSAKNPDSHSPLRKLREDEKAKNAA